MGLAMLRLAHLSDVHLAPLPPVPVRLLVSKRITGWLNWHRNRGKSMGSDTLALLLDALRESGPDHIAVTGDLTNLALPEEIERARVWLGALGAPDAVSVIPGNHDAYVPGALTAATASWRAHMTGERVDGEPYPYLRRLGRVALIGCSSAEATLPFQANGPFRSAQAKRLEALLRRAGGQGLFRVVMIHHPPVREATGSLARMLGIGRFQRAVERAGAELVLHGHTHLPTRHAIDTPGGRVPVVGVAAAGQAPGGHRPPARFNLFEINGTPGKWRCLQVEIGIGSRGAVGEIDRHALAIPAAPHEGT